MFDKPTYFGSFRSTLYSAFQANFSFYLLGKNSSYFLLFLWKILIFFEKPLTNPSYRRMMNPKRIVPVGKATTGIWTAAAK